MTEVRHAVVTGGGSGLGLAIARRLRLSGAAVTIMGRDEARLQAALGVLPGAYAIRCDVGDHGSVSDAFAAAERAHGPVGILVNAAGIAPTAPFERTDDEVWESLWRINVMGCVHTSKAVLPAMRGLPFARIVNVGSTASLRAYPYVSAYVATKHALLGLTRALALELAGTAITVNAVCPGYADTEMIRNAIATIVAKTGRSPEVALSGFTRSNPQSRLIEPDEVAAQVEWLVSGDARSVTGQAIVVAGGEIM